MWLDFEERGVLPDVSQAFSTVNEDWPMISSAYNFNDPPIEQDDEDPKSESVCGETNVSNQAKKTTFQKPLRI